MKQRSSQGHLTSVIMRFKRIRKHDELMVFQASDEFLSALNGMNVRDRHRALWQLGETHIRVAKKTLSPRRWSRGVKWDVAQIARLVAADAKFPGDDVAIACWLNLSRDAVRRARGRYLRGRSSGSSAHDGHRNASEAGHSLKKRAAPLTPLNTTPLPAQAP